MEEDERRVESKKRGTVPWDEAYERRKRPHKYKELMARISRKSMRRELKRSR